GLALLLVGCFVSYTTFRYKQLTGYWQYAPFSGWQMANNAMYTYRYVDSADRKPVPARFRMLDNMIRHYFDTSRDVKKHPVEALQASTVYMWDMRLSPLYAYRELIFSKDTSAGEFKKWASMGPLYKDYGVFIIRTYPAQFLRYFVWPNARKYYSPPVEFLEFYNSGRNNTAPIGQTWFKYKSARLYTRTGTKKVTILNYYPILSGITNIVLLFILIFYLMLRGSGANVLFRKGMWLGASLWLINAGFTIFASSAALRFQAFPVVLSFTFMLLLVDWLIKAAFHTKTAIGSEDLPASIRERHEQSISY
ncbi:MAG: hypothetical protein JST39_20815, partial [Bacteroidetes bacterium]|nr:hypothetical protein [Bacteroidota bacterium]